MAILKCIRILSGEKEVEIEECACLCVCVCVNVFSLPPPLTPALSPLIHEREGIDTCSLDQFSSFLCACVNSALHWHPLARSKITEFPYPPISWDETDTWDRRMLLGSFFWVSYLDIRLLFQLQQKGVEEEEKEEEQELGDTRRSYVLVPITTPEVC